MRFIDLAIEKVKHLDQWRGRQSFYPGSTK